MESVGLIEVNRNCWGRKNERSEFDIAKWDGACVDGDLYYLHFFQISLISFGPLIAS